MYILNPPVRVAQLVECRSSNWKVARSRPFSKSLCEKAS